MPTGPRKLGLGPKLAFGIGQMAEGVKNNAFNTFVVFYYNQVLELPGTLSGLALAVALVFDAVTDPIAGSLSDKLKSRWGRRHPFMVVSAFPLAITFVCLFSPPSGLGEYALFAWLVVFAVLVRGSMTAYHIPHLALGAEMASDYHDRSSVFMYSTIFGYLGGITCIFIGYSVFFPPRDGYSNGLLYAEGYPWFAATFGAVMVVTILWSAWGTRREIPYLPKPLKNPPPFSPMNVLRELGGVFRNRSFRSIFFGMLLGTFVLTAEGVFQPYMGVHFWELETTQIRFIPLGLIAGLPFAMVLTPILTRRFDKRNTLVICAVVAIINPNIPIGLRLLEVPWFPPNGDPLILPILVASAMVSGAIAPVIFITLNSLFADICDEYELETNERVEGIVFATRAFAVKATGGAGLLFGGVILDLIQFPTGAEVGSVARDVIVRLGIVAAPIPSLFLLGSLVFYFQYKLDRHRHAEIAEELVRRRRAAAEAEEEEPPAAAAL